MTAAAERFKIIAEGLWEKTSEGALKWYVSNNKAIYTKVGTGTVFLNEISGKDGLPKFQINIYGSKSNTCVDSFDDDLLTQDAPQTSLANTYWDLLSDLYKRGHRSAIGADEVIDDIISALKK
jgi:hypothetical protein